ncbi:MAG TPA: ABC transporter permease [Gemmatimonadaceae bacterium]
MRATLRFLARRKAATIVSVLTLALALGVNTVVFSVLKSFLITGMAVPDVERLQVIQSVRELAGRGDVVFFDAYPNYEVIRESQRAFSTVAVLSQGVASWDDGGQTRPLQVSRVSASFFEAMRVFPAMGGAFSASDEGDSPSPVVLVSHSLWQAALAADPNVVGRVMTINGAPHTVIGVMPAGFSQPSPTDIWMPFSISPQARISVSGARSLFMLGRLSDDAGPGAVTEDAARFTALTQEAHPADNRDYRYRVTPYRRVLLDTAESAVAFVQAGAIALLLLAVSNLAPLLVAWGFDRHQEVAVRQALGAAPGRTAGILFLQSALVVGTGALIGAGLAYGALPWVRALDLGPTLSYFTTRINIDVGVLLVGGAVTVGASVLAGLLPVWFTRQSNLAESLRSGGRTVTLSPAALRWQKGMVFSQAALSVVVLSAAGLIAVSFWKIISVPHGFVPGRLQVARVQLGDAEYGTEERRATFARQLMDNLSREPTIAAAAFSTTIPVGDLLWGGRFYADDARGVSRDDPAVLHFRRTSENYLEVMGIPLLRGRSFARTDDASSPPVAIVSQAVADRLWPGENPIGKRLSRVASAMGPPMIHEVIGVAGNVMDAGLTGPAGEAVYAPYAQVSVTRLTIVVEPRGSPREAVTALRNALRTTDATLAAHSVAPLALLASQANALQRLQAVLLATLASIAVGIVGLGTYGVMSQVAATREKEFAIRLVFGASPGELGRAMFLQTGRLTIPGIVIGIGSVILLGGVLDRFVFGIEPRSITLLSAVGGLMLAIAAVATITPAVRAMRVEVRQGLRL